MIESEDSMDEREVPSGSTAQADSPIENASQVSDPSGDYDTDVIGEVSSWSHVDTPMAVDEFAPQRGSDTQWLTGGLDMDAPVTTVAVSSGRNVQKLLLALCGWSLLAAMTIQVRPSKEVWVGVENVSPLGEQTTFLPLLKTDQSYGRIPNRRRFHDHGLFTLGHHHIRVSNRTYDHWYLGFGGQFLPLPYLPRLKKGKFGFVGLCLPPGVCAASIVFSKTLDDNDLVTVLLGLTGVLFFLWQWPGYWTFMFKHTTFSIPNFRRGRLHTLFLAPLSQRSWVGALHQSVVLANVIGDMDSFMLLVLYFGGCLVTWWLMNLWKPYESRASCGGSAGCTALFVFECLCQPHAKRSMGFIVGPAVPMRTWQACIVHAFLHFGPELIPAASWGLVMYGFWIRH